MKYTNAIQSSYALINLLNEEIGLMYKLAIALMLKQFKEENKELKDCLVITYKEGEEIRHKCLIDTYENRRKLENIKYIRENKIVGYKAYKLPDK